MAALPKPAAFHDGLDLGGAFVERANLWNRVRQPDLSLVNKRIREDVPSLSMSDANSGIDQYSSTWLANDPAQTSSMGPSPNT
jgi:hypothetical protein